MHNDTHFLADCKVMDYSILVGIDEVSGGMVIGIIDYVRASAVAWGEGMRVAGPDCLSTLRPQTDSAL